MKMISLFAVAGCAVLSLCAFAQEPKAAEAAAGSPMGMDMKNFKAIRLDEVGLMTGSFNGTIDKMTNGVRIALIPEDPAEKELPIAANDITFSWPEGGGETPTRIVLEGKVKIDHPQMTVRADKADWDFVKESLTFTGSPVISTEQVKELQGERITVNFKTNTFEVQGGKADNIQLGSRGIGGSGSDPSLLKGADVKDWAGLLGKIKEQASGGASPGKRVMALLDPKVQKVFASVSVSVLLENKEDLLKHINKVLAKPNFYDAASFQSVSPGAAAAELIAKKDTLTGPEKIKLNRLMFEAAYPGMIAPLGQ
jgi:lipopolysaccharide export system protein LptA